MEKTGHDDENLHAFEAEAESWAERERERDLMAVLIEAAQLKSAAREWYHRRPTLPPRGRGIEAEPPRSRRAASLRMRDAG